MTKKAQKTSKKPEGMRQFSVYMDAELVEALERQAVTEERSMNFILTRLVKKTKDQQFLFGVL